MNMLKNVPPAKHFFRDLTIAELSSSRFPFFMYHFHHNEWMNEWMNDDEKYKCFTRKKSQVMKGAWCHSNFALSILHTDVFGKCTQHARVYHQFSTSGFLEYPKKLWKSHFFQESIFIKVIFMLYIYNLSMKPSNSQIQILISMLTFGPFLPRFPHRMDYKIRSLRNFSKQLNIFTTLYWSNMHKVCFVMWKLLAELWETYAPTQIESCDIL